MHTEAFSELSARLTERGIITTGVMPFCLVNPNHASHSLGRLIRDLSDDDIADAFGVSVDELLSERVSSPTLEDAVAVLMSRRSGEGDGWLVRFYLPGLRGGYTTKLIYGPTMADTLQRMLQA